LPAAVLLLLVLLFLCLQADEELREGKLRFRGGRGEAATYDEGDEVRIQIFGCVLSNAFQADRQSACWRA
jgi:hypothetical protein